MRRVGLVLLIVTAGAALTAPWLAPHSSDTQFSGLLNAPPTIVRVRDATGAWRAPFVYRWIRVNQLEQTYEPDRTAPVPLAWLSAGHLVSSYDDAHAPLLLLGADSFGRDVFSRLLYGRRVSLAMSLAASLGALFIGALVGGVAGYAGGFMDEALMRATEFVLVLPAMYVTLALRAAMPPVLGAGAIFLLLAGIFAVVGAPLISRGVRAIVRTERALDYAVAARSLGAGHLRLLLRHLLPATRGFLLVELTILVPAFVVAEATLSYVGFGFPDSVPSWGTMLHDASSIRALADFPWLLSPAAAMFIVVLAMNLMVQERPDGFMRVVDTTRQ